MPPEHGVVSSNLTGRATLSGTKSEKRAMAKHYIKKPSLRLMNEALRKVEAKCMSFEKKVRRYSSRLF